MMKKTRYRQCELEKAEGSTIGRVVSFLPEKYSRVGEVVKLKDDDGNWSDGWVVKSVGDVAENPPDWRMAIRRHKQNTGDSLPKNPAEE